MTSTESPARNAPPAGWGECTRTIAWNASPSCIAVVVVVDHDTGWLVWAEGGRDRKTLDTFFPRWVRVVAQQSHASLPTSRRGR